MPDPSLYEIPGLIINPGAHWVPENGSSPEAAAYNMTVLAADVAAAGETVGSVVPLIEPTLEQDRLLMGGTRFQEVHDGRYPFLLTVNGEVRVIEMPGLPIEEVRYIQAEGQSIWDFPRVFIDGSSWVWCYAVSVLSTAGAGTVLVVDDDPVCLDLLSLTLGREGYRVIHARSGEEAMLQARAHHPQAITLDVLMPKMDGWSTLVALKADPVLRDIPVIMLTVLKDRGLAFSLGAADFMTKPVDRAALTSMLRQYRTGGADLVLVVEDDPAARGATRRLLEKLGLTVAEASNGLEGLRWLDANSAPALILLDLMMPVMDGFEFLEELQRRPALGDVPVVVLTAKQLMQEEIAALTGRTKQVMTKQATSNDDLVAAIRKCVQRQSGEEPTLGPEDQATPGGRLAG